MLKMWSLTLFHPTWPFHGFQLSPELNLSSVVFFMDTDLLPLRFCRRIHTRHLPGYPFSLWFKLHFSFFKNVNGSYYPLASPKGLCSPQVSLDPQTNSFWVCRPASQRRCLAVFWVPQLLMFSLCHPPTHLSSIVWVLSSSSLMLNFLKVGIVSHSFFSPYNA